jgi:hypothetical protein
VACGDLGSAILTLVSAYILGHVIQITANGIIHPKIMDRFGKVRFPSDILLDAAESLFSPKLKERIAERCREGFDGIDISAGKDPGNTPDTEEMNRISRDRGEAFFRARSTLVHAESGGYAEQFEGLYAMMAGTVVGLGIAGSYFVGWAAAFWEYGRLTNHFNCLVAVEIIFMVPAVIFATQSWSNEIKMDRAQTRDERIKAGERRKVWEKALAFALSLVSLWAGILIGCRTLANTRSDAANDGLAWIMILLTMGTVMIAIRLYV